PLALDVGKHRRGVQDDHAASSCFACSRRSATSSSTRLVPASCARTRSLTWSRVATTTPCGVSMNSNVVPCSHCWLARRPAGTTRRPRSPNDALYVVSIDPKYHRRIACGSRQQARSRAFDTLEPHDRASPRPACGRGRRPHRDRKSVVEGKGDEPGDGGSTG